MRQEAAKLTEHDSGPSLATATSGEIQPGGFAIVNRELNEKEQEQQLAAGQQVDLEAQAGVPVVFSGGSEDIEAQTGVPMPIFPGAFAIAGVDNDDDGSTSESESSDLDDAVSNTGSEPQPFAQVQPSELPTEALEAELHEEVIVEGAVVNFDDDHEGLDQKSRRRLRTIQLIVLCFSCAAIAMVVASVLGGFSASGSAEDELVVEGWTQVGSDVYGPIEEPQTLFGSAVAMSADGTILAVTAPGTDDGTSLNVGEVRIFQESQNETETTWTELKKIQGPGPSNDHVSSLAMSTDANWLAVGYPRLMEGSRVQLYGEVLEGAWVPVLDPIVGPGDGDEEWFGYAVDLSAGGDILAIGAPKMNQNGAVQIYRRTDSAWEQIGEDIVGHQPEEYFGWSVTLQATDGLRVAVGAPVSNDFTGLVRIFDWDGTAWEQVGEDLLGDISLDRFGESVSLSADGKVLAVGAVQQFEPGQAHVFREVGGQWVKDKNTFVGEEDGEGFGSSVALSSDGNVLAIGGPKNSAFGDSTGRVQVLKYDQETAVWVQEGSNIGHEDMSGLGSVVALSADGTRVAAGAPNTAYVGSIPRAGSVQVYDRDIEDEGEDAQE
jgi:WD40 repeat protein